MDEAAITWPDITCHHMQEYNNLKKNISHTLNKSYIIQETPHFCPWEREKKSIVGVRYKNRASNNGHKLYMIVFFHLLE